MMDHSENQYTASGKQSEMADDQDTAGQKTGKFQYASGRGKETLFRVTFRNQINLIAIADNKANMIISLNAVLISLIIAVFGSGITIKGQSFMSNETLVVPFTILMFTCLFSAILAILTAKPHILKDQDEKNPKISLLFFGNYYNRKIDDYLDDMNELLSKHKSIYDNLIIDIYYQGKILHRKYRFLKFSYIIFLTGIILTVLSYLLMWILN